MLRHSCRGGHGLDHGLTRGRELGLSLLGPRVRVGGGGGRWTFEFVGAVASSWRGPRYGVRGAPVDEQGGGVVVGDGGSGQCGRRSEAHSVAAI